MEPTNKIKALLEKYWLAETTDAEEAELRKHFHDIPAEDDQAGQLFQYFRKQQTVSLDESFDTRLETIMSVPHTIPIWRRSAWKIAAALLIVISTVMVIQSKKDDSMAVPLAVKDTYQNPELALNEARHSLLLISEKLNKAKQYSLEIKRVSNALQIEQLKKQP